jgi:hypothetical protein
VWSKVNHRGEWILSGRISNQNFSEIILGAVVEQGSLASSEKISAIKKPHCCGFC